MRNRPKLRIRFFRKGGFKKEGITPIRCDTLTIHQERRYLSAIHISKNEGKTTILILLCVNKVEKSAFLRSVFCLLCGLIMLSAQNNFVFI